MDEELVERKQLLNRVAREVAGVISRAAVVQAGEDGMIRKYELVKALADYFATSEVVDTVEFTERCYGRL